MTSRQRVRRAVEFDHPDRVPRDLWALPIATLEHGRDGVAALQSRWPGDFAYPAWTNTRLHARLRGDPYAVGQFTDDWGCTFENLQAGVIGEVKNPLVAQWSDLDRVRVPVERFDLDVEAINALCRASDKFMFAAAGVTPFERMQFLRGSENLYADLAEEPPELFELLRIVRDFSTTSMELWAKTEIDALVFNDDWGSQRALLISPNQWRRLFKPMYAEFACIARDHGKKIFMHSDGCIFDIYQDLIEIGIDAINSQLFCMDIEQIGRQFKGRITFWGEIDRQHMLPRGTREDVRAAVERVVDHLWSPEGGVIAQFELGGGAKMENAHEIYRAWDELTRQ